VISDLESERVGKLQMGLMGVGGRVGAWKLLGLWAKT
jgi:hypothetical protein